MNKKNIDKETPKYTSRLIVRLTPQLHKEIAEYAALCGLTTSAYARKRLEGKYPKQRLTDKEMEALNSLSDARGDIQKLFGFLKGRPLTERENILRSEILYQSINLMIISHISCYNCCNLIFLLSWCHSPFIYHFRRDALNQGPLLKSFFFANQLPATPYKPSLCLLFTGAWHAPVIRSSSRIFTNESSHAFHTYPNTLVLPFPVLPRLVLF